MPAVCGRDEMSIQNLSRKTWKEEVAETVGVDWRIILKHMLQKSVVSFSWLGIGVSDGLLCARL